MTSKRTMQRHALEAKIAADNAASANQDAIECGAAVAACLVPMIRELADYRVVKVRGEWSVYLRKFNVRVATISAAAPTFRLALERLCDAAATAEEFETKKDNDHAAKNHVRRKRSGQ